ncbi:hypothetical protein CFC21_099837 [Triticum aestivum]|uniref:KIB1-4 beta-propeller domain-containing protein n=3 Tax=Triticum TaxID=4564 RepID=A0A9R0ZNK8_TRITD|nr:hypothetical protein CFC21_099837 [Triticum aestivum]VAI80151.1 unnamed protein product [Triticum turgidum subsp. durum]
MNSPSRLCVGSGSKHHDVSTFQGWVDLPDALLHSIVGMLTSSIDILAFAVTCRSWHAAFFSYPSKSIFRALCPPLFIREKIGIQTPFIINGPGIPHTFNFIDPSYPNTPRRYQIREDILHEFRYGGSSYGLLIFFHNRDCLVVDAFSGAEVSPPRLPNVIEWCYCSTLTAPLASPNSHLLVSAASSLLDWSVGSDTWSELTLFNVRIQQIVELNGQFIAMDNHMKIYTLQLAPQLSLQNLPLEWCHGKTPRAFLNPWLVICHDMLLLVCYNIRFPFQRSTFCTLHRLDMSNNPATWVEMKKLNNWALFVPVDTRDPPFSCINPERWGGRSNCLYYAQRSHPWGVRWLGNELDLVKDPSSNRDLGLTRTMMQQPGYFWVYPSTFYSDGR